MGALGARAFSIAPGVRIPLTAITSTASPSESRPIRLGSHWSHLLQFDDLGVFLESPLELTRPEGIRIQVTTGSGTCRDHQLERRGPGGQGLGGDR